MELFFDIQQIFDHKIIQELKMSNSYKVVEQHEDICNSDYIGWFYALWLGNRFVQPKVK